METSDKQRCRWQMEEDVAEKLGKTRLQKAPSALKELRNLIEASCYQGRLRENSALGID